MVVITNGAREIEDSISLSTSAMKTVALRGSLKEKLTLSFIIKSTNLKILDTIGQGWPFNAMNNIIYIIEFAIIMIF